jgi:hypothetical protein
MGRSVGRWFGEVQTVLIHMRVECPEGKARALKYSILNTYLQHLLQIVHDIQHVYPYSMLLVFQL